MVARRPESGIERGDRSPHWGTSYCITVTVPTMHAGTSVEPMPVDSVLLYPGAGGDRDHHTLVALEDGLDPINVTRRDFSYRARRKGPPDRAPKLIADVVAAVAELGERGAHPVVLGGRSMGGRMCSMAIAQGLHAAGLILLSYPLHPPGKPETLRTEHFADLYVPCLFISGTRDPFGTPEELTEATRRIRGPVTIEWLEGERHDPKACDEHIVAIVGEWLRGL